MIEHALVKALINAGVGAFIAVLILIGLYIIVGRLGGKFIDAQMGMATATGKQAQAMETLATSIRDLMGRDNGEHREIILLLKVIMDDIQKMKECTHGPEKAAV